jgi:hypothetical protein
MRTQTTLLLATMALLAVLPTVHADPPVGIYGLPGLPANPPLLPTTPFYPRIGIHCERSPNGLSCAGIICTFDPMSGTLPIWPDTGTTVGVGVSTHAEGTGYQGYSGVFVSPYGQCGSAVV